MTVHMGLSRDYSGFDNDNNEASVSSEVVSLILRRRIFVIVCFLLCAVCVPILLYLDAFDESKLPPKIEGVCLLDSSYRISCGNANISEANCSKILCCFERKTNSCYHQEPSSYFYYQKDATDSVQFVPIQQKTPIGLPSVQEVRMNYFEDEESLKIYLNDTRVLMTKTQGGFKNFDILSNDNRKLSVTVYRKNTTEMLLTTLKGPLIINKDYLEWTIQLTNNSGVLFGLGQLKIESNENSTLTKIIYKNQDDHNTLPMFMAYNNGKYHAAIIHHEGALQVTVLPSYLIHLKAVYTGGVQIEIIDGPTPKDIYNRIRKQQEPYKLFPEWIYGLHICREEPPKNMDDLKNQYTSFVSIKNKYPEFTYESECIHDDLLLHLLAENYTSTKTSDLFNSLQLSNNFILSFPPQIPLYSQIFQKYKNSTIFFKNATDGRIHVGKYKNFEVVYPIYSQNNTEELIEQIAELFQGIKISGLTFTNSWPQDDGFRVENVYDPFITKGIENSLSYTIPWNIQEGKDIHARYHNEYGSMLSNVLEEKFKTLFTFFPVSNYRLDRPSILQNVNTTWANMKKTLTSTLFNSLFGRNYQAVPVCGSNSYDQKLQEDLCLRWYLIGATMPLIRVSSKGFQRSPINLYTSYAANKVINILDKRRSFIPYYRSIIEGGFPLIRPMFFNFPDDKNVHGLDEQYMIGDAILVAQPVSMDIKILKIYLPPGKVWYEIWGGKKYQTKKGNEWIKLPIVESDWVSFVLEGQIIPLVKKTSNGPEITLIIAMKCDGNQCQANGSMVCEDLGDELIQFSAMGNNITIEPSTVKQKQVVNFIKSICIYNSELVECRSPNYEFIH